MLSFFFHYLFASKPNFFLINLWWLLHNRDERKWWMLYYLLEKERQRTEEFYKEKNVQTGLHTFLNWSIRFLSLTLDIVSPIIDAYKRQNRFIPRMLFHSRLILSTKHVRVYIVSTSSFNWRSSVICWNCCRKERLSYSLSLDDRENDPRWTVYILDQVWNIRMEGGHIMYIGNEIRKERDAHRNQSCTNPHLFGRRERQQQAANAIDCNSKEMANQTQWLRVQTREQRHRSIWEYPTRLK